MHLPLKLRLRIVAGRKVFIPVVLVENNEITFILRFILSSLKFRNEKTIKLKLLNEFLDIFNNKGLSIKKKIQYNKDIKENIPNIRYLNF
jgi:small subunit ribosomal protein S7